MLRSRFFIAGVVTFLLHSSAQAASPSFMGIGVLPGWSISSPAGVSADGSVVAGTLFGAPGAGYQAFRWTAPSGMVALPFGTIARDVSADGSAVVGQRQSLHGTMAFRWTSTEGTINLGFLPNPINEPYSEARAVSANGAVVVGVGSNSSGASEAFRWTEAGGMQGLGFLGGNSSHATDVSADGAVVVGLSGGGLFRWTAATGMVDLGVPTGFHFGEEAGVSADGSVVVGSRVDSQGHFEAFRWTEASGPVGLGSLVGFVDSYPLDVSGDGSTVVGYGTFASGQDEAFLWSQSGGMRFLRDVLSNDFGLNLTGWTLNAAGSISADGLTIVGYGRNPSGSTEAWVAHIPEPGTWLLVIIPVMAKACKRGRNGNARIR